MKKSKKIVSGALMGLLALGATGVRAQEAAASAEEAELSASLDVSVLTDYIWRGQLLNDEAVLQPSLTVSKGGFSINWWANNNLTDNVTGDEYEFSEHDIGLSYSFTCPLTGAGITAGIVNYDFPNQALTDEEGEVNGLVADTTEGYLIVGFGDVLLSPTLSVYYDFKEADGFYGNLGVSHSFEMCSYASVDLAASVGFADSDWNTFYFPGEEEQDDALVDGNISLTIPMTVSDSWTITPGVQYTTLLESDIEDTVEDTGLYFGETDRVVGSIKASYAF